MNSNKVFITGGTGFVGKEIINRLIMSGYQVKVLVHNNYNILNNIVKVIKGNILEPDKWIDCIDSDDTIINLVGIIREDKRKGITFKSMHIDATKNILDVIKIKNIKRYIHMSATGASIDAPTPYLTTKYEAEEAIKSIGDIDYTIFRPSIIFGSEDKFINTIGNNLQNFPIFPIFGNGQYQLQPIYVKDVAKAFIESINNNKTFRKVFHLGGNERIAYIDLIRSIANTLNIKGYYPSVSINVALFITKFMQYFKFYPITVDQINMLIIGNICPESEIFSVLRIELLSLTEYLNNQFNIK